MFYGTRDAAPTSRAAAQRAARDPLPPRRRNLYHHISKRFGTWVGQIRILGLLCATPACQDPEVVAGLVTEMVARPAS